MYYSLHISFFSTTMQCQNHAKNRTQVSHTTPGQQKSLKVDLIKINYYF